MPAEVTRRTGKRARPQPGQDRLRRGLYIDREKWGLSSPTARHLQVVWQVAQESSSTVAFAGVSAAVLLGLPVVGASLSRVEQYDLTGTHRVRTRLVRRHRRRPELTIDLVEGRSTTGLCDTLLDLARWHGLVSALAAMDWGLHHGAITACELAAAAARLPPRLRGRRIAQMATCLADSRAESPGESLTRARLWQWGLAAPELQQPVETAQGTKWPDFAWPQQRIILEFDGRTKYRPDVPGQDPAETLWREKQREDALRAGGWQVVRCTWRQAYDDDGRQLVRLLLAAGVPRTAGCLLSGIG